MIHPNSNNTILKGNADQPSDNITDFWSFYRFFELFLSLAKYFIMRTAENGDEINYYFEEQIC